MDSQRFLAQLASLLSWFAAAVAAGLNLIRRFPLLPLAGLLALGILLLTWSCERQARLRQAFHAELSRQQADAEISRLQAEAERALREAGQQHAGALRSLDSRRRQLEREAQELRASLARLHQQGLTRVERVATLPAVELARQVTTRLGPAAIAGDPGSGVRGPQAASNLDLGAPSAELSTQNSPAPGGSAPVSSFQSAISDPAIQNPKSKIQNLPRPESSGPSPVFSLSDRGLRQVATSLAELDACREELLLAGRSDSNCRQQIATQEAIIAEQKAAMEKLNQAIVAKDQILTRREAEFRAEIKAARSRNAGWRARFLRAVEYVALGFVLGVGVR